ncbi:uncharacterized protein LOC130511139 [Raphanus sativus]|uniref:Uncharacterized protein LOC130511139 n=1 Tax=Raphanus sativus TaxID=3726 RepID=A0A9W3DJB5_RAPSA|nr:uncharacterized protein LOC130511139 [Raphanus sativus]
MGRKRNKKGAKDEGNAAEVAMEKAVQRVQAILREHSEQEIRETLLQCNLNHNVAIDRLLSQQDASNEQGASTQSTDSPTTTSSSVLLPNQSGLPNVPVSSGEAVPLSSESSSSAITNDETRSVPISSSEAAPYLPVPSTSDVTNGESRSVPISSTEIVPRLSVSSSRYLSS